MTVIAPPPPPPNKQDTPIVTPEWTMAPKVFVAGRGKIPCLDEQITIWNQNV